MKAIVASDLHGNRNAYDRLFEKASEEKVDCVIIAGDNNPKRIAIRLPDHEVFDPDNDLSEEDPEIIPGVVFPGWALKSWCRCYGTAMTVELRSLISPISTVRMSIFARPCGRSRAKRSRF